MKKLLCALLAIGLFLAIDVVAFAQEQEPEFDSCEQTFSEYEIFKSIKTESYDTLVSQGISAEKIDFIKSFDFDKYAEKMRNCSDAELREKGLTEEAIRKVRNSNDDATILAETMGKVTYRIAVVSYTYDSKEDTTSLTTNATWTWSVTPVQTWTDAIGCRTSDHFHKTSGSTTITYYMDGHRNATKKTFSADVKTEDAGLSCYSRIPMRKEITSSGGLVKKYYALEGSCKVNWKISGMNKSSGIASNYGHAIVTCTPKVTLGSDNTLSFSPIAAIQKGKYEAYTPIDMK